MSTAAVVVGIVAVTTVVVTQSQDGEGAPDPAQTLPPSSPAPTDAASRAGDRPGVPYIRDGFFETGSESVATTADRLQVAAGTALLTDTYDGAGGETSRSVVRRGDQPVAADELDASIPVLSADGRRIAALTFTGGDTRITTYEVGQTLTVLDRLSLTADGSCCGYSQVGLLGFDDAGRVYLNDGEQGYVWDGGRTATPITGTPGPIIDVGPEGVVAVQGEPGTARTRVVGDVSGDGTFERRTTVSTADPTEPLLWSTDGGSVAYTAGAGPVVDVLDDASPARTVDVGNRVFSSFVAFEDDTTVLLIARTGNRSDLLRCEQGSPCTVVWDLGGGFSGLDGLVFPE